MIPVMKPKLPRIKSVEPYLAQMDDLRVYTNNGPLVRLLEKRHADRWGIDPQLVVSVSNATLAIQGCITVSPKNEWVCPNFTFAATAHAVIQSGKKLHLADVGETSWALNLVLISPKRSDLGIIPVMPFGAPVDLGLYADWDHVVIDAAASLGSRIDGLSEFKSGHFIVFSLHATKVLGSGEGAIVVCGSNEAADELRSWCNFGFKNSRESMIVATNAKMSEVSAAYGLASLDGYLSEEEEWHRALEMKNRLVTSFGMSNHSDFYPGFRPYWIFDLKDYDPIEFARVFNSQNIEIRRWWPKPISEMFGFEGKWNLLGQNIFSPLLANRLIGLPMFRDITESEIERISKALGLL